MPRKTTDQVQKDAYRDMTRFSSVEEGQLVIIGNPVPSFHLGWDGEWTNGMDKFVGKPGLVTDIDPGKGIKIKGCTARFPIFSITPLQEKLDKIFPDYRGSVTIAQNGKLAIGCVSVGLDELEMIAEAARTKADYHADQENLANAETIP